MDERIEKRETWSMKITADGHMLKFTPHANRQRFTGELGW